MGQTENYGLNTFASEGDVSEDGYKFSRRDRVMLDRMFKHLETHVHDGSPALADPTGGPTITLGTSVSASIPAGLDLYYRVSYLDEDGLETAASEEYTLTTPDPVEEPDTPAVTLDTGGSLAVGTYYWLVTAYQDAGGETRISGSTSLTFLVAGGRTAVLTLPALPAGADGFNIYRRDPGSSGFYYLDQVAAPGTDYTDDGTTAVDRTHPVPLANTTNSQNLVTIVPPDVPLPTGVVAWRIYRSFISGVYATQSLVHEVVEREDEFDPGSALVATWDDVGDALLDGIPLDVSHTMADLLLGGGTLQSPAYSAGYTPDSGVHGVVAITLTGNITINNTTATSPGERLVFAFTQDVTGGRTVTWGSQYHVSFTPDTGANKINTIELVNIGTSVTPKWVQLAATTGLV